ncbi:phosphoribosylformimino-5-aminoimidazole carboxamide ribotide isomerase [Diplocloster modestus]|uniref:Phosphoribosylformimino-5-aminoimidazole carboxamide ribotide isomerase n=1 Tax=Diplocloster modestus TaxID=2850322 RepID=A0ABS6K7G1_9FIRM|nr:phosphoribosylformimino-5-aminoimidazole carboxamide ribotide isomerase [Diplocloster modestus]MBU9726443.1 phosphoribosylformimino-5-aminoimidazole carboxamide ribotide isomerase [Diplocloster modestus]
MKFRPCIDIHNGQVKQIVGGSLQDQGDQALENFVAEQDAAYYARFYQKDGLSGGHIILLNHRESPYYEATRQQAELALKACPGEFQIGGGIALDNALEYLRMGASHVIVTSYVFREGNIQEENLKAISRLVGREHLVLDLSCRRKEDGYYIVTDRWQNFTEVRVNPDTLDELAAYCGEFLIHAADVEGRAQGIEFDLVEMLGDWEGIPVTYAGGVGNFDHLEQLYILGQNRLDVTIGSALDLFGGSMDYNRVLDFCEASRE